MKNALLLLWFGWLAAPAFAQKIIDKTLPVAPGQLVNLNLRFADSIRVRYWDKPTLSVRIAVTINGGKLNDALLVTTNSTDSEVSLQTDFDKELSRTGRYEDCPDSRGAHHNMTNGPGYSICSRLDYDVYVPRNNRLKVNTISGNLYIEGAGEGVDAKTISGFIDMNWPKAKGANVAMKTITGEVYTNLPIDFGTKLKKNPIVGYQLQGNIGGGGPVVRLESISNDIYLRSQK